MKITAVILTKNEEKNIKECLESLSFCDEIIVIDDNSTDRTTEIVCEVNKTCKVTKRELKGDFAAQRNFGLKQAGSEWVLFIDADERISKKLKQNIMALSPDDDAYAIKRRDFWWGKELKYGETGKARNSGIIRLVRRDSGIFMGDVHEVFHTASRVGRLDGFLDHYPHPTVKDFLKDINIYSSIRANELLNQGQKSGIFQIIFFPLVKFKLNYFIYLGFLDGPAGFAYAFFMSFHSFLVRAKLYQLSRK